MRLPLISVAPQPKEHCPLCGIHNPPPYDDHQEGCPTIAFNFLQALNVYRQGEEDGMWGRVHSIIWKKHKAYQVGYEMGRSAAE